MSSSRERLEEWIQGPHTFVVHGPSAMAAWQARDAEVEAEYQARCGLQADINARDATIFELRTEVAKLVEALREARVFFAGPDKSLQQIDALLAKYEESAR